MITERLMRQGSWSLQLASTTPQGIRDRITPFASIVITNEHVPLSLGFTDGAMLDAARYTGIIRRLPRGDSNEVGGVGNVAWLGDDQNKGDLVETYTPGTLTFVGWWQGLLGTIDTVASPLTIGDSTAITAPAAGELTEPVDLVTRRFVADKVGAYYGGEFRVNPDFTVDVGAESDLFVTSPRAMIIRDGAGFDPAIAAIALTDLDIAQDVEDYASGVVASYGDGYIGSAATASTWRDPQGNLVTRDVLVTVQADNEAVADELAAAELARRSGLRQAIRLKAADYLFKGSYRLGDTVWVFDPEQALVDTSNVLPFRGLTVMPTELRVTGVAWPPRRGMGFYQYLHNGTSVEWLDLTEYVVVGGGDVSIEVGASPRSLLSSGSSSVATDPETEASSTPFIAALAATVAPTAYPPGFSRMAPSSDTSWPASSSLVETFIFDAGGSGHRIHQLCHNKTGTLTYQRFSSDGSTWDSWQLVTPYSNFDDTTTQYEIVAASTWETAFSFTISALPTTRFDVRVSARGQCYIWNKGSGTRSRARVDVSRDGGSTWSTGQIVITDSAAGEIVGLTPIGNVGGAVTGTIQIRLMVFNDDATTHVDNMHLEAMIVGNH